VTALLGHLRARLAAGHKLLVPYVVAGYPDSETWPDVYSAAAGPADAIEIGIPYSDPVMDGPVIAAAAGHAIARGTGPREALAGVARLASIAPRIAMTYYNPVHHIGEQEFCRRATAAGIWGLIVPDLPVDESASLRAAAAAAGLAWIPLVAPTSSRARVATIAASATGFVYAVSALGVTGTRESLSERASAVVAACREATDLPVIVGIGVSTAEQAVEAARTADGVVIGSAVVRLVGEAGAATAGRFLSDVRAALDRLRNKTIQK
jgi:tryptophan synthase alpha chain